MAHLSEKPEEHVSVEGALMGLVHDYRAVVVQIWLPQRFPQKNPIRHVFYYSLLWCTVFKTDGITNLV